MWTVIILFQNTHGGFFEIKRPDWKDANDAKTGEVGGAEDVCAVKIRDARDIEDL